LLVLLAVLLPAAPVNAVPAASAAPLRRARIVAVVLFAALLLQAVAGVMISVRLAGAACADGCTAGWMPGTASLFDPTRIGSAAQLAGDARAGQPLQWAHWLGGFVLLLAALWLARWHSAVARAGWPAWTVAAAASLGAIIVLADGSAAAGAAHAIAAGLALAACATVFVNAERAVPSNIEPRGRQPWSGSTDGGCSPHAPSKW